MKVIIPVNMKNRNFLSRSKQVKKDSQDMVNREFKSGKKPSTSSGKFKIRRNKDKVAKKKWFNRKSKREDVLYNVPPTPLPVTLDR